MLLVTKMLLEATEEEFEEAVFAAPHAALFEMGLARVKVAEGAYGLARARLLERLAGHELLKFALAKKTGEREYTFICEGLTGCTCHGGRKAIVYYGPMGFIE